MRILLANYRYFVSGGPERYMFNVGRSLAERGYEIIPFSIRYTRNEPTPYDRYFVEPLGSPDEVLFRQQRLTLPSLKRTLLRLFYDSDVESAVVRLVGDTRPQIAYVLHYLRKLSPALLTGLKKARLPIVVRLSDYGMLCPGFHCLRDSMPCGLCVGGDLWPSIRYQCVQRSRVASGLNAIATMYHRFRRFFNLIDVFVVTTRFMYDMMARAGFAESRLKWIPTFVDGSVFRPSDSSARDGYIAFGGRLEEIKGLEVLVDAVAWLRTHRSDLDLKLKLAGTGDPQYIERIRRSIREKNLGEVIDMVGMLGTKDLVALLSRAVVSVVPSLWYENLPNAILESYACGTPVLASNLGSLAECVIEGETGFLFRPGDAHDLAVKLTYILDNPGLASTMSAKARGVAETTYSPAMHIRSLEELFAGLEEKNRARHM